MVSMAQLLTLLPMPLSLCVLTPSTLDLCRLCQCHAVREDNAVDAHLVAIGQTDLSFDTRLTLRKIDTEHWLHWKFYLPPIARGRLDLQ